MTELEFVERLLEISQRSDRQWHSPSGAIITLLKELIREGKVADVADAATFYFRESPEARHFVAAALPAIFINNYRPLSEAATFEEFLAWSKTRPSWSKDISDHMRSAQLPHIIKSIVISVEQFKAQSNAQ
jgi:hypothetical protein